MLHQQLYNTKPVITEDVCGNSSKTVFIFMKAGPTRVKDNSHPWDVDDWERNRALLICYPKWRVRIKEMAVVSKAWEALVNNWENIEEKYEQDYQKYGNNAYKIGECDAYIRSLLKYS